MKNLIDIHLHLDGSLPFHTVKKLSKLHHFSPISNEMLHNRLSVSKNCHNLNEYLKKFSFPLKLMQTKSDLEMIVYDLLCDLRKQGLIYVEIRFAPQLHVQDGMSQEEVVRACDIGYRNFLNWQKILHEDRPELHANFILCCMRMVDNNAENMNTVLVANKLMHKCHVVGIDLAGAETEKLPIKYFKPLFDKAKDLNIPYTIHAGEALGPDSIRQALALGTKRIGHGIRCTEDASLVKQLIADNITLECCATSNLNTKVFSHLDKYPIRQLLNQGVRVTLNTDNMTVSNTTLPNEYKKLEKVTGLLPSEEKQLLMNSINASFANISEKKRLQSLLLNKKMD